MPKQPGDLSKAGRMLLVLSAVKLRGRATPDDIFNSVAREMGFSEDDKNLRRNIYRDLKHFSDSGKLGVQYFTPDGSPIAPDDEESYNNIRVEYYLPEDVSAVVGHRLLKDRGGIFVSSPHRAINWKIQKFADSQPEHEVSFVFEVSDHSLLRLSLPVEELPVKLLVARDPGEAIRAVQPEILTNLLGPRFGALYLGNRTMSRPTSAGKAGHAVIEIGSNRKSVFLTDLESTSGTQWLAADSKYLRRVNDIASQNDPATLHPTLSQLRPLSPTIPVTAPAEAHALPLVVVMGGLPMLVI